MKNVVKILTALATVAGAIYIIATYGEQIVAWAKKLLNAMPKCPSCEEAEVVEEAVEEPAAEEAAEEPAAEEVPVEEAAAEAAAEAVEEAAAEAAEVVVAENEPVAAEEDFAE